jgi:hypothetical protein
VLGVVVAQLFTDEIRYTGVSVAYNIGAMTGGLMPTISVAVLGASGGNSISIVIMLVVLALISIAGVLLGRRVTVGVGAAPGLPVAGPAAQPG